MCVRKGHVVARHVRQQKRRPQQDSSQNVLLLGAYKLEVDGEGPRTLARTAYKPCRTKPETCPSLNGSGRS